MPADQLANLFALAGAVAAVACGLFARNAIDLLLYLVIVHAGTLALRLAAVGAQEKFVSVLFSAEGLGMAIFTIAIGYIAFGLRRGVGALRRR